MMNLKLLMFLSWLDPLAGRFDGTLIVHKRIVDYFVIMLVSEFEIDGVFKNLILKLFWHRIYKTK